MSLAEAAQFLGISRKSAYSLATAGSFPVPAFRVGSLWKVNRSLLEEFVANGRIGDA